MGRAPRLLVLVAVDGLPWDLLWSHRDDLTGGLRVLLEESRVETACRYRHLNTETAPGHASLSTGALPSVHGIVGNRWCEVGRDGLLRTEGAVAAPHGEARADGRVPAVGPYRLRVPTLGDRLVESSPGARVVSVGGKDRAAILLAGKDPRHVVYWQALPSGRFETSAYYDPDRAASREAARIVARFNDARSGSAVGIWLGRIWGSVSKLVSGVARGRGVGGSAAPLTVVFSNDLATDLALELIESREIRLGRGEAPDLLCLAYSETDAVFHAYGTESREAAEALRRLDGTLERLLHVIRREFPQGVVVGLSADHGFLPTSLKRTGTPEDLRVEIDRRLVRELCLDPSSHPVAQMHGWALWYDRAALPMTTVAGPCGAAGREVGRADLDRTLRLRVAGALGGSVEDLLPTGARASWAGSPHVEFAENLLAPGREADAYVFPKPGVLPDRSSGASSDHGSHHDYDVHVPLLLWGDGIRAGMSESPCTPYDLTPTLAARTGIVLPDSAGRDLLAAPTGR